MNPIFDRLDLLERRVASLEAGRPLPADAWQRPAEPPVPRLRSADAFAPAPPPPRMAEPRVARVDVPEVSGEATRPGPIVPTVPALVRHAARAERREAPKPARDLESWLGAVVLGRVGIAAVVLAAAYFAQLAYKTVDDTMKVLSLYALGAALVGAGSFVRARVGPKYVGLLWGGATAVTYIAGLAATLRYHIVDPWTGVALLAAACALGQMLSRALRQQTIATVSVAAAMSAPFLLGVASSPGPWILLYAAAVHAWSAWTERAWTWTWARNAALAGVAALAWAWMSGPAMGSPAPTFFALHVLALTAMAPELLATWRGGAPRLAVTVGVLAGVGFLDVWLLGSESWEYFWHGLHGGGLLAGAAWLGLAALIAGRASTPQAWTFVRGLAGLGGMVLAAGAVLVWRGPTLAWGPLASLALLAPGLLVLRRRVRAGDAGVVTAAVLAFFLVISDLSDLVGSDALTIAAGALGTFPLLPLALIPAGALVGCGRTGAHRATGLLLGAATLAFPFAPGHPDSAAWAALGLTLPALWAFAGHERARSTGDGLLAGAAELVGLVLAATWALGVTTFERALGWKSAFDPFTWSALAIAGVLLTIRLRPVPGRKVPNLLALLMAGAVGLLLLAGGREVHLLTRDFPPAEHSAALALFAAAAGLALAVHARVGDRLGRAVTALLCLGGGGLLVLTQGLVGASGSAFVLGLLGVGAAAGLSTEILLRRRGERPGWLSATVVPLLALSVAWIASTDLARHAPPQVLWNHRFLGGFGLAVILAGTTWSAVRGSAPPRAAWLAGSATLVIAYLAGLFELVQATRPLAGAWAPVLVSLYTAAVGAVMLVLGFAWRLRPLRLAALAVFGAVVVKVGLHDLSASDLPLRVLVTGALGLVLLGSAYAYARRRRAVAE